jgi:hypothetical protein
MNRFSVGTVDDASLREAKGLLVEAHSSRDIRDSKHGGHGSVLLNPHSSVTAGVPPLSTGLLQEESILNLRQFGGRRAFRVVISHMIDPSAHGIATRRPSIRARCLRIGHLNQPNFVGMGPGVLENEQPIADVYDVDQPVFDNWIAPEHGLVIPAGCALAKARILVGYKRGIDDRFGSQTPCFGKVLIVSSQPEEVEASTACESGVRRTKARKGIARINPTLIDTKILLCLRVIVKRNTSACSERHKPESVPRRDAQWASPDPGQIVADIFEALSEMRHAADYGWCGWLLRGFRGLIR